MTADPSSWDEAVARLEEVLAAHPFDLDEDERAQKILAEAIRARPLSSLDAIAEVRTQIEVLAVEIGMLHRQLEGDPLTGDELEDAGRRLAEIRSLLDETNESL